jgi:hypothetical protein
MSEPYLSDHPDAMAREDEDQQEPQELEPEDDGDVIVFAPKETE